VKTRIPLLLGLVAAAAVAVCAAFAVRPDTESSSGDVAADVQALRREVGELRAQLVAGNVASTLAHLDVPDRLDVCGQPMPLDRAEIRDALAFELILTAGKPTMPLLWMRRSAVVMPDIEAKLKARGLPDDLKYLPMIESDMRWVPESPAGAVGLWQFMERTGKRYGLRVDGSLDERMDPERSTDAALGYLAELRRISSDWFLALASYNAGEGAVQRAVAEQGTRSYFDLYLPLETRRYVYRLAAAKLIYENPEKYGLFRMAPLYQPKYRHVDVDAGRGGGDLRDFARAQKVTYATLRTHNPQLRGPRMPSGKLRLRIPEDAGGGGTVAQATPAPAGTY
jgi:membrane-bound lytic murein transglycosylase D